MATSPHRAAFTLIELMVAVSLMTLIVLGLISMFTQTQRAFRASLTQTDLLESGRLLTDLLGRELSEVAPSGRVATTNFFARINPQFKLLNRLTDSAYQGLPGTQDRRTNIVQDVFFLSQNNQTWTGYGYRVFADYPNAGVGSLYRFITNNVRYPALNLSGEFINAPATNLNRITDGVVHFKLRAFATNGFPIYSSGFSTNNCLFRANAQSGYAGVRNSYANLPLLGVTDQSDYYFMSNAVPAYLELEVGILEPHILDRFRAIGGPLTPGQSPPPALIDAQRRYLSNHVAQVHVFRQRIPIRTVDFTAYQ